MFSIQWLEFIYCVVFLVSCISSDIPYFVRDSSFSNHHLIYPKIYHGREKREISSSSENEEKLNHIDQLSIAFNFKENEYMLHLQLNKDLLPKRYFEKYQKDGKYIINEPLVEDVELCQYHGHIEGVENSWVALSTCNGIRGVMFDGKELHYIEKPVVNNSSNSLTDFHLIYSHSDLMSNFTCGFSNSLHDVHDLGITNVKNYRFKRNAEIIQRPYNANKLSRYIELVLVVDNREYRAFNDDIAKVNQHCKDIANIINSLYIPLNIFVALVGVVVWTEFDEFNLETNGDKTLNSFLTYRKDKLVKEHPNDNAQLLTRLQFESGVVGKALKGPICSYEFSGGVNMDHSTVIGLVAATVAHEMGHNLGMEHDEENKCLCPSEKCIMSPSSSSSSPTEWSSCSKECLALAFDHGMDYCLRNKPSRLFEGPVCGNGFVEPGEQCDCGLKNNCNNPCCNASTCMLYANASCATGECCDFQTCKLRSAGTMCRSDEHECDLPEYCTGQSEYCPDDVFKIDGESCLKGMAFCYQGNCRSHTEQCKILWGPSGVSSNVQCYQLNTKGDSNGNCGYNRLNQSYIKCEEKDIKCGILQCKHTNERLEFGLESAAIMKHTFINSGKLIITCRTALIDFGLNEVDPGLVPDGAKCEENHMCFNQKCMSIESLRAMTITNTCPDNCNDNGICNSKGHCHCNKGYSPPDCRYSGVGGSEDSGPAENPFNYNRIRTVFFYMMLTLVPLLLILFIYSYYIRRSSSYFWKRSQRRTVHCEKSVQIQINRDNDKGGNISSTIQSLLCNDNKAAKINDENLKDNLIQRFKGFTITPLPNGKIPNIPPKLIPTRPAPAPTPIHNIPVAAIKPIKIAPTVSSSIVSSSSSSSSDNNSSKFQPPLLPPPNASTNRPLISSPKLDNTTSSTVKELINKDLPVRPAPPVPIVKDARPISTPCTMDTVDNSFIEKTNSKQQNHTLNRIASLISKSQPTKTEEKKEVVSLKAAKIDKDTLKNLKISNPIPLIEPSIPTEPLPLLNEPDKSSIMRTHSMRYNVNKQPPGIQSFASVRLSSSRRPTSIPAFSRPTSPPPCPPLTTNTGISGCQLPISTITSSTEMKEKENQSEDNIYAVIEENPIENEIKNIEILPTKSPVLNNGEGLLKEIVTEIQARNLDSIYSASNTTKPEEADLSSNVTNYSGVLSNNKHPLSENTASYYENEVSSKSRFNSSSSSVYLKPLKSNSVSKVGIGTNERKLQVPEKTAPTYKPFNTPKKPVIPITNKVLMEKKLNQNDSKSSQNKSRKLSNNENTTTKSSVSSVINKFDTKSTHPIQQTSSKGEQNVKINKISSESNAEAKLPKTSNVASIQKKFENQSQQITGGTKPKSGKPTFKK